MFHFALAWFHEDFHHVSLQSTIHQIIDEISVKKPNICVHLSGQCCYWMNKVHPLVWKITNQTNRLLFGGIAVQILENYYGVQLFSTNTWESCHLKSQKNLNFNVKRHKMVDRSKHFLCLLQLRSQNGLGVPPYCNLFSWCRQKKCRNLKKRYCMIFLVGGAYNLFVYLTP